MHRFTLFKSQLLYGTFKPKGLIFDQSKRLFNLKTPLSVEQSISPASGSQNLLPQTIYTYSTLIQCVTCQSTATCFSVQVCAKRNDIKKKKLKAFLQEYHYQNTAVQWDLGDIRYILEEAQKGEVETQAVLTMDRFFIIPQNLLKDQGFVTEKLERPVQTLKVDKLRCSTCNKCLGYLLNPKNQNLISNLAFLNLDKIQMHDQLAKDFADKTLNEQIKSIPVRIDAAWYNVGLAQSSVSVASKQIQTHYQGFQREFRYQFEKMKSKVTGDNEMQNIQGLQM